MTQEKQKVLEMLNEGKITSEQAKQLLKVLDCSQQCKNPDFEQKMSEFHEKFETQENRGFEAKSFRLKEKIYTLETKKLQLQDVLKNALDDEEREDLLEEIEDIDDEIEELTDEIEELVDSEGFKKSKKSFDINFDFGEENLKRQLSDAEQKIAESAKKLGAKSAKLVALAVENAGKAMEVACGAISVERPFSPKPPKDPKVFDSFDGLIVKEPSKSGKDFSECKIFVKYRSSSSFNFNGDFEISNSGEFQKILKPFLSESAWKTIEALLEEQFKGYFKQINGTEVLKVEVK